MNMIRKISVILAAVASMLVVFADPAAAQGSISGRATYTDFVSGYEGIRVELYRWDGFAWGSSGIVMTDVDGRYAFSGLVEGGYQLKFSPLNANPWIYYHRHYKYTDNMTSGSIVDLGENQNVSGIDVIMYYRPDGVISGKVVGLDGSAPLEGIHVQIHRWDEDTSYWSPEESAYTDVNGEYSVIKVGPGSYRLRFFDGNHVYQTEYYNDKIRIDGATDLVLGFGEELKDVNVVMGFASPDNLELSAGTLDPVFDPWWNTYRVSVPNKVSEISIAVTRKEPSDLVTINGAGVQSGKSSPMLPLKTGENTIVVVVKDASGVEIITYVLTVDRAASSNAKLANLEIKKGAMSPRFNPKRLEYKALVKAGINEVRIKATADHSKAKIKVNGRAVKSGRFSRPVKLIKRRNTVVKIKVIAQDGSVKTYRVTIQAADG